MGGMPIAENLNMAQVRLGAPTTVNLEEELLTDSHERTAG